MNTMSKRVDVAIVGAGPAGLSAAVNAVARGKSVRIFTGENNYLTRAEYVDNYLGLYHLTGKEMMEQFLGHAAAMGIVPEKGRVSNILSYEPGFMLNFNGDIVESETVILAIGVSKAQEIPGEAEFLGRGVSYCATCDGMLYRGKKALVWGLAPDAVEEAGFLHSIGVSVTFVSRGERPSALQPDINFLSGSVNEVIGNDRVEHVLVGDQAIDADVLFILRNSIAPATLVSGLETDKGYVLVNRQMQTNIPGLFAAGDCTGLPLQVANAVGDGLVAALQAAKYLDALKRNTNTDR